MHRIRKIVIVSLFVCNILLIPCTAYAQSNTPLDRALQAAVFILDLNDNQQPVAYGSGSLVAWDNQTFIITNYHVIEQTDKSKGSAKVFIPNPDQPEEFVEARGVVLVADQEKDLAVLQALDTTGKPLQADLPTVPLGDVKKLKRGEPVNAIGYPSTAQANLIITQGIFSGLIKEDDGWWVVSDVNIAGGNSGGLLINQAGELVAIPTKVYHDQQRGDTLSYARPINEAIPLLQKAVTTDVAPEHQVFCADDFTSNQQDWPLGLDDSNLLKSEAVIAGGAYQKIVHFNQDGAYTWVNAPNCNVKDFLLQVEATILQASDKDTGIVLLLRDSDQNDQYHHYRVVFYLDNSYTIELHDGAAWKTLQERTPTQFLALNSGKTNSLAVRLVGTQITVYANAQELATVTDDTLTAEGEIGLGLIGNAGQKIKVAFDDFQVGSYLPKEVLFYDFFVDNHNGWKLGRADDSEVDCEDKIANGRLEQQISIKSDTHDCFSTTPTLVAQDFWLTVDATLLRANQKGGWLSLPFRYDDKTGNQYELRLSDDGYYTLELYYNDVWYTLQKWTQSAAIDLHNGKPNTIQLWVHGSYITLVINNVELTTVQDSHLSGPGKIMLGAGGEIGMDAFVVYDKLVVRQRPPVND